MPESKKCKSIIVDVDGTLCPIKSESESYSDLIPSAAVLKQLSNYRKNGFRVILHTARNMRTFNGNQGEINKHTAPILLEWLDRHKIEFDEIHFAKPWPGHQGFYLDDRAVRPREFLHNSFQELEEIMANDRKVDDLKTQVVITMAGRGSRFAAAGYTCPKFMITSKGLSLFYWSMLTLSDFIQESAQFFFIALKEHEAKDFIDEQCRLLGISGHQVIEVDEVTEGQASTVLTADGHWDLDAPLLIYNIDTYVEPGVITRDQVRGEGWIPCMEADGSHWSFVKCDSVGRASQVTEKLRISDNCSIGLYWFETCQLYIDCFHEYYKNWEKPTEKYIAPIFSILIDKDRSVYCDVVPTERVHPLGTPKELHLFQTESE
jgi:capsule biosynthesis phosphatase